jgi:probable phosphoglycerate mutase
MHELAQAHVGGTIAIVCHGGVLDCLYRAASSLPMDTPRTWSLENAAINRLTHDAQGFAILSWGDTGHLHREPTDDLIEHFPGP